MTKLSVDIPQTRIDEAAGKELATARRRIKTLETKITTLEHREEDAKRALLAFKELRLFLSDNFDLYEDYGF